MYVKTDSFAYKHMNLKVPIYLNTHPKFETILLLLKTYKVCIPAEKAQELDQKFMNQRLKT